MEICAAALLAISSSACAQILPPPDSPALALEHSEAATPRHLVERLSNAELISRLPRAGQEWERDKESGEWRESPASLEWSSRVEKGKFSKEELDAAIRQSGMLYSSAICFTNEVYHVSLRIPSWLPFRNASAKPHLPSAGSASAYVYVGGMRCGNESMWQEKEETFQPIGVLPANTTEVSFVLELTSPKYRGVSPPDWSGQVTLPVQQISKTLPQPIDSRELTALIREQAANISLFTGTSQDDRWIVFYGRLQRPLDGPLASTLMGFKAEIMKDQAVIAAYSVPDPDEGGDQSGLILPTCIRGEAPELHKDLGLRLEKDLTGFMLRVSGEAPLKPSRWGRTSYWSGQYTVPLSDVLKTRGK